MTTSEKKQSGQAAFEYVLLLTIVMVLGMGLGYQFNSSVQQLAAGFFGKDGYLECLVNSSELPFESETCSAKKPQWKSYKAQKPKLTETPGSGGVASNRFGPNGNSGDKSGGSKSSNGRSGKENSVPANSADRRNGSFNGFQNDPNSRQKLGGDDKATKKDAAYTGSDKVSSSAVGGGGAGAGGDNSGNALRPRYIETSRSNLDDGDAKVDGNVPATSRDLKSRAELIAMGDAKRKTAGMEDPVFSMGNFLKYAVLGILLIAVIFFVGSQLYSISKGAKGEK